MLVVTQIFQGDIWRESTLVYPSHANKMEPRCSSAVTTKKTADDADERGYDEVGTNFRPVARCTWFRWIRFGYLFVAHRVIRVIRVIRG